MKTSLWKIVTVFLLALSLGLSSSATVLAKKGSGGKPGGEAAGNNLSFPVIWSEGVTKALRGEQGVVNLGGAMWYWWGTDPDGNPYSCLADLDDTDFCNDDLPGSTGPAPCDDRLNPECITVFQQQDSYNDWQAESANWSAPGTGTNVSLIDWGDNLESQDWYTRSKVRTEVVLIKDLTEPMLQYGMRHLSGLGINEVWGLATIGLSWNEENPDETVYYTEPEELDGYQATVYSHCARLTIQKLLVPREYLQEGSLTWDSENGWWTGEGLITEPIFNKTVWEGGDGPGYYSAEINVKGKVIYGYTWDVKTLNDMTQVPPYDHPTAAGDYRITFSLARENCPVNGGGKTFFDTDTQILPSSEGEVVTLEEEAEEPGGGAVGKVDVLNNLTYMDVRILERSGGRTK